MRAGTYALSLLSVPLNVYVLRALEDEPRSLLDLRRVVGSPPQTTVRAHLQMLTESGVLKRNRRPGFSASVDYELDRRGRELLIVMRALEAWLADSPEGPLALGSIGGKSAIKALVDGWTSSIIRALAARPFSLTELNKLIGALNYPSLERRLGALRLVGLIEPCPGRARGTPYGATEWLRRSIGPLAAAARWECQNLPAQAAPIGRGDIESAFLLTVPLVVVSPALSGSCRLAAEVRGGSGEMKVAGVMVELDEGRVVSCAARLQGNASAWASGIPTAWIGAVVGREAGGLEVGGDQELALEILEGLHQVVLRAHQPT